MQSTRRGSLSVHRSEKTPGSKYSSTSGLSPRGHLERQAEFHASTQDEACLSCPQSAGTLRSESEIRGTLRFLPQLEMRPSSNAPNPVESREAPPTSSRTITPHGATESGAKASMSRSRFPALRFSLHRWQESTDAFLSSMSPWRTLYRSLQVRIRRGSFEAMMTPRLSISSM